MTVLPFLIWYQTPSQRTEFLIEETTFILPLENLIDINKEHERLATDAKKLKEEISYFDKKLANKNFIDRAPKDIIKLQREKRTEVKNKLDITLNAISRLQSL